MKVWDFQFLTLDYDVTPQLESTSEITVLNFVSPFPLVLAADSDGGISLIPVRPYLGTSRYKCLLRFENAGSKNFCAKPNEDGSINPAEEANCRVIAAAAEERCAACVMEHIYDFGGGEDIGETSVAKGRHLVITGDEHGWVRFWDISAAIEKAQLKVPRANQMPKNQPSYNPYRRCERDGNMYKIPEKGGAGGDDSKDASVGNGNGRRRSQEIRMKSARQSKPKFSSDVLIEDDVVLLWAIPAHKESISSIEIISDPASILTASVDGSVMLWDMEGREMGTLTRGREADSMWKRVWSFPVNKALRKKQRHDEALAVYEGVKMMESKDSVQSAKHAKMVEEMRAIRARTPSSRGGDRARTPSTRGGRKTRTPTHMNGSEGGNGKRNGASISIQPTEVNSIQSLGDRSNNQEREGETKEEAEEEVGSGSNVDDDNDNDNSDDDYDDDDYDDSDDYDDEMSHFSFKPEHGHGPNALIGAQWEIEKGKLFGQLKGEETWNKTPKEMLREKVMEKRIKNTRAIFKKLQAESKKEEEDPYAFKKRRRGRRKGGKGRGKGKGKGKGRGKGKRRGEGEGKVKGSGRSASGKSANAADAEKSSLPTDDDIMSTLDSLGKPKASDDMEELFSSIKAHNIIIDDDRDDPENWAISSTNRQKSMYGNFYDERDKIDRAARRSIIAKEQLANALSKPSDFIKSKEVELLGIGKKAGLNYVRKARGRGRGRGRGGGSGLLGSGGGGYGANEDDDADGNFNVSSNANYDRKMNGAPLPKILGGSGQHKRHAKKFSRSVGVSKGVKLVAVDTVKLGDLESMVQEAEENQASWRQKVEDFRWKVFGEYLDGREEDESNGGRNKKSGASSGLVPRKKAASNNSIERIRSQAVSKARSDISKSQTDDGGGKKRRDRRAGGKIYFGPYSAKEVMVVGEAFVKCVIEDFDEEESAIAGGRGKDGLSGVNGGSYARVKNRRGSKEQQAMAVKALGSRCHVHKLFGDSGVSARPHYVEAIKKLSVEIGHKAGGTVDIVTILKRVFPYMNRSEVAGAVDYLKVGDGDGDGDAALADSAPYSPPSSPPHPSLSSMSDLSDLFRLYDPQHTGSVPRSSVLDALSSSLRSISIRGGVGKVHGDQASDDGFVKVIKTAIQNLKEESRERVEWDEFKEAMRHIV